MRRKERFGTLVAYTCLLALYPAGIILFDWLTHDWPNLPWQLGGFAALLLIGILWSRWNAARRASASRSPTGQ